MLKSSLTLFIWVRKRCISSTKKFNVLVKTCYYIVIIFMVFKVTLFLPLPLRRKSNSQAKVCIPTRADAVVHYTVFFFLSSLIFPHPHLSGTARKQNRVKERLLSPFVEAICISCFASDVHVRRTAGDCNVTMMRFTYLLLRRCIPWCTNEACNATRKMSTMAAAARSRKRSSPTV